MHWFEQDITYLRSTVHELEDYLLSDILFWPIRAKGRKQLVGVTQLTIGNLLLSLKRLKTVESIDGAVTEEFTSLTAEIEKIRLQWKSNWDNKVIEELRSRLKQWDHYLSEIQSAEISQSDYAYNIRQRVILALLIACPDRLIPLEQANLDTLDERLKKTTHPSSFVWDADLQSGFPEDGYWFLYRTPA